MSTYPGENPQPSDNEPQDTPTDTELTQPVGYWERQAAEQAREQEQQGHPGGTTTPLPQSPQPPTAAPQNPYGEIPGVNPYGPYTPGQQQPGAQPPYAGPQQPGYPPQPGQPVAYGQPGIPPYQQPYNAYGHAVRDHPQSTMAMVLGLVGLVGCFVVCGLSLVVSPFAWVIGSKALKEIRASHGQLGGEGQARAGMIMGIIGTVLLILAVLALIVIVVLIVAADTSGTSSTGSTV